MTKRGKQGSPSPKESLRQRVHRAFHQPAVEATVTLLILASVALIVAEAGSYGDGRLARQLEFASDVLTWIFAAELPLRAWAAPKRRRFFREYWIDIVAVLPLIRPLRLLRVLRLLRLFRVGSILVRRLSILRGVLHGAGNEFTLLATATLALVLTGSVTLFLVEQEKNADFGTLPRAIWYTIFSLIAGEPTGGMPQSLLGRSVSVALMIAGMTVFAVFVGTVSAAMVNRFSKRLEVNVMDVEDLSQHVLVCGWNHTGPLVVEEIMNGGGKPRAVVIITEAEEMPDASRLSGVRQDLLYYISGDYTRVEILEKAAVSKASTAILLSDKTSPRSDQDRDARTVLAALTVERLCPGIFTCAELRSRENESLLRRSGVEEIVVSDEYSGLIMGSVGRTGGLVATLDEILSTRYGNAFYKIKVPERLVGAKVSELYSVLKSDHDAVLVALEKKNDGRPEVRVNPSSDQALSQGDYLVVITSQPFEL